MNKKPSLSIHCKQQSMNLSQDNTITHSLSRKKQFLTIVTPSQLQPKHIKTLKEIKRIAQGIKTAPSQPHPQQPIKTQIIPMHTLPSFLSQNTSWRRNLTIDLKPYCSSQKCEIEWSGRTMATRQESREVEPQTPINRLL